jgi:hypothetical protein
MALMPTHDPLRGLLAKSNNTFDTMQTRLTSPTGLENPGPAEKNFPTDEPAGFRELVEMGAIEAKNPQAREVIARWLLMQVKSGESNNEKLKALVIDRFSKRS